MEKVLMWVFTPFSNVACVHDNLYNLSAGGFDMRACGRVCNRKKSTCCARPVAGFWRLMLLLFYTSKTLLVWRVLIWWSFSCPLSFLGGNPNHSPSLYDAQEPSQAFYSLFLSPSLSLLFLESNPHPILLHNESLIFESHVYPVIFPQDLCLKDCLVRSIEHIEMWQTYCFPKLPKPSKC